MLREVHRGLVVHGWTDGRNDSTEMVEVMMMMVVVMGETEEEKGREAGRRKEKKRGAWKFPEEALRFKV